MAKKKEENLKVLAAQYAELVAEEKTISARKEELQVKIKAGMADAGADRVETNFGTFSTYKTSRWEYSPAVKALQEQEKEKGIATKTEAEAFKFTPVKVKTT